MQSTVPYTHTKDQDITAVITDYRLLMNVQIVSVFRKLYCRRDVQKTPFLREETTKLSTWIQSQLLDENVENKLVNDADAFLLKGLLGHDRSDERREVERLCAQSDARCWQWRPHVCGVNPEKGLSHERVVNFSLYLTLEAWYRMKRSLAQNKILQERWVMKKGDISRITQAC